MASKQKYIVINHFNVISGDVSFREAMRIYNYYRDDLLDETVKVVQVVVPEKT